jgi:bifunctional non-homologous end joining protein LigD
MATRTRRPRRRPLDQYRDKRDFDRTPEPAGSDAEHDGAPRFVVQRHRARRLHYDFRLEIDGVLVSWAVPKGLTLDPGPRHLAVHVEDHPLEYGDFEGVIPKGEYGAGDVIVWDRGTWELHGGGPDASAALEAGELHLELHGEKLRGHFMLIRTREERGREQWLVFHKRDDLAVPGWDPEEHPRSVVSGRDNDEVARDRERVWTRAGETGHAGPQRPEHAAANEDELATLDALPDRGGDWEIGGRTVRLTHLDKQLFPGRGRRRGVTKRELVRYHAVMGPWMLPYLVDRPLNLHRYPDGIDHKGFWQKQAPAYAPDWIERWTNPDADEGETTEYLVVAETAALVWLANHAAVELHPWTSTRPDVERPTYALIDLDPGTDTTWDELLVLARLHRTALEHLGVRGYPKTTGRRGIQVWIPIEPGPSFDETRAWVKQLSDAVAGVVGDLVSEKWEKQARGGKARLDYTQNAINKTLVAPYSVRAGASAPVSMPITWDELDDPALQPDRWDVRNAPDRVAEAGDPMARMLDDPQVLVPLE